MPELDDSSPLTVIRAKERELTHRMQVAKRAAEALIAQVQEDARVMKHTAERDGLREAEAYYREELEKAEQVAAQMKAASLEEAGRLRQRGRVAIGRAVQVILAFVLPE
jgi:uncharacterized membrane protein